jgi:hydantoinase/carbamoylase family amidase
VSAARRIDADRMLDRLRSLRTIGATASGGVTREAFGPQDVAARDLVASWFVDAGLQVEVDPAANLIGRRAGHIDRWLATGSHLDTVVDGGWLDGAYGVVAGVEVAAALADHERFAHGLLVAAFSNEEGARGTDGMTGSRAVVGAVSPVELQRADDEGWTLAERIERAGGAPEHVERARWPVDRITAFVELHIEQGPVLDGRAHALGVVPAISGRQAMEVVVRGRANHAGATPMSLRHDALAAAADVVLAVEALAHQGHVRVATCGNLTVVPNVRNVVAGVAHLGIEVRDEDASRLEAAVTVLDAAVASIAERRRVAIELLRGQVVAPVASAPGVVEAAEAVAAESGQGWSSLPSGAGHDAQILGGHVASGMLFVRSVGGVSHAADEDTSDDDLVVGAQALLDVMSRLDRVAP